MNVYLLVVVPLFWFSTLWAQLTPVALDDWGLKIVIFDVGQGDGTLLLTPNGQAVLIDTGETKAHGETIAGYLLDKNKNGVATIDTVESLFISHYHRDHMGGVRGLVGKIKCKKAFDRGPSPDADLSNHKALYTVYVEYVGDKNDDGIQGPNEPAFVRRRAELGQEFKIGANDEVIIRILSVSGDTAGTANDLPLRPKKNNDPNPGSIIQLVTLNDFEYLTTGDATSKDWKGKPDSEAAVIRANAIPGGHDIDVLKVAHHGSDTSSGKVFIESLRPEVGIISSDFTGPNGDKLPKLTSIKMLEMNSARVLVTGRATNNQGQFHQSLNAFDDGYVPVRTTQVLGMITILVAKDGSKYTVRSEKKPDLVLTFSSADN